MAEDEMVGWHHQLNGHEFEQAPGHGEGQESLACFSPRHHKESDMTEQLKTKKMVTTILHAGRQRRHRCKEQTFGLSGRR